MAEDIPRSQRSPSLVELEPGTAGTFVPREAKWHVQSRKRRLVRAILGSDEATSIMANGVRQKAIMTAAAADLSCRRCPVLISHDRSLDATIGRVEAAWLEGNETHAILRFGRSPRANTIWRLIEDDLPVAVSMGMAMLDTEPVADENGHVFMIIAKRWRLIEVSVCGVGLDPIARVITPPSSSMAYRYELEAMIWEKRRDTKVARRQALLRDYRAIEWGMWAPTGAAAIARRLGVDANALTEALRDEMANEIERLIACEFD